jgi:cation diffusion facilitator family transporter
MRLNSYFCRGNSKKMTHSIRYKQKLILISFVVGVVLMGMKFAAYFVTNSNAILTDALESIINIIAAGFAFYSIYLSSQPKDKNHPYGHGKIEFFSAGFEGALIIFAGIFIIYESILNLIHPAGLQQLSLGLAFIVFTALTNLVLGLHLSREGKRMDSLTLIADGKHLIADSISSIVLAVGILIMNLTGFYLLDSFLSLAFALVILYNGYQLIRKSVAGLMDEVDTPTLARVVQVLKNSKKAGWIDIHNLRVQKYGADLHIDCHLTMPYYWNLQRVHDEVHALEDALKNAFTSNVEVFVHADPCLPECCHYCQVPKCPVRSAPWQEEVDWNLKNLSANQKHFVN